MSISIPGTWDEALCYADLVYTHFMLTGRNPTDAEHTELVEIARNLLRQAPAPQ